MLCKFRENRLFLPAVVLLCGLLPYLSSLFMEHVIGLKPCHLCLYQRYLHLSVGVIGLLALLFVRYSKAMKVLAWFAVLTIFTNMGVAAYHSGVERHIFKGPTSCTGDVDPNASIEEIRKSILAAGNVRCDEPAAKVMGLTLAELNVVLCLILAGTLINIIRCKRYDPTR